MRYCVRCGNEISREEYIENVGLCIDCYLKYRGVFTAKPVLDIVYCPRCGSWRWGGEWQKPAALSEVIRRAFLSSYSKYIDTSIVSLVDVEVLGELAKVYKNRYKASLAMHLVFNNAVNKLVESEIEVILNRKPCPKCLALSGKSHKALIQLRSEKGGLSQKEKRVLLKMIKEYASLGEIVEISENKYGLDVKVLSLNTAKKLVNDVVRLTGARVIESFRPVRYDPRRGKWRGITTLSVRLPSLSKGDLVEYRGEPAIVRSIDSTGISIELLNTHATIRIGFEAYWKGLLKKYGKIHYERIYRVIAVDRSTVYLLNEDSGEIREYPRTQSAWDLAEGATVYIIRHKSKEYLVKT